MKYTPQPLRRQSLVDAPGVANAGDVTSLEIGHREVGVAAVHVHLAIVPADDGPVEVAYLGGVLDGEVDPPYCPG